MMITSHRPHHVSIIIPVYNDYERLVNCLEILHRQTYPRSLTEILVVDNGSHPRLNLSPARFPLVRLLRESTRSSYAARNTGIAAACGDVLAFTDADCTPYPDWLEQGVQALTASTGASIVAGKITVFPKISGQATIYEHYDRLFGFQQEYWANHFKYGACANLFTYRTVLAAVGVFNPSLKSLGDSEWCVRAARHGHKLIYSDKTIIRHPARNSFNALMYKTVRTTGGVHETSHRQHHKAPKTKTRSVFLRLLKPNSHSIRIIFEDESIPGWHQKLMILALGVILRACRICESLRLMAGNMARNS